MKHEKRIVGREMSTFDRVPRLLQDESKGSQKFISGLWKHMMRDVTRNLFREK